jgi:hypothetical protein
VFDVKVYIVWDTYEDHRVLLYVFSDRQKAEDLVKGLDSYEVEEFDVVE